MLKIVRGARRTKANCHEWTT